MNRLIVWFFHDDGNKKQDFRNIVLQNVQLKVT